MSATEEIRRGGVLAGRYKVRRRLGSGGMATVFLAEDSKLGRDVAIKRLHTDAPKASLTRFQREAKLGAALNHPNLVSVYDTLVTDDQDALIVMEYVPGESLADIAARGAVPPERALPILRSLGEALDHVHAQDVVHRDVKPANVLVRDDGFVKLADLGIAKAVGATQLTSEGSVIGTLPYMSPERMRGPGAGGPESDVYALAAVAYEVLSGEPPRETASTEAMTEAEQEHFAAGLSHAPPAAAAVLQRGLDPNPSKRPVTATRLVEELDSALAGDVDAQTVAAPLEA
ncbi:MAG: serine/threonine protein kinase, partial [Solirubrobacterales bacterium]|nr:serine/threonine protein kinase [Solirubrobacterales bacterium]